MKLEYLFIGPEHREHIEAYTDYNDSITKIISDIKDSDCWVVSFSLDGENEKTAKKLSPIHDYIVKNYKVNTLSNECSAYFNKTLFPLFNKFERNLRKLLYTKSALSDDEKASKAIADLESKDLGKIFELLFTDSNFNAEIRTKINVKTWQFTKSEVLSVIDSIDESTVWDILIGHDAVPSLRSNFINVKNYRNDVMHAHNIDAMTFNAAQTLINNVNKEIEHEINQAQNAPGAETHSSSGVSFNTAIIEGLSQLDKLKQACDFNVQYPGLQAALAEYNRIVSSPSYIALQQQIQSIQKDIPAINRLSETIEELNQNMPNMAEYQEALKAQAEMNALIGASGIKNHD